MKIILDVMGGDNPPAELIKGAVGALDAISSDIVLVGHESLIRNALASIGADADKFVIVHSESVITMEDGPMTIVQKKKDSSMAKALTLLADGEGDAVVSCGNTGALFTGATLIVRRAKGIRRAAIGTILPYGKGVLVVDSGANVTVTADYMVNFAHLGSIYMKKMFGLENPRVAIINNGVESHKGTPLVIEARELLEADPNINFVGSVEGSKLPYDVCDVAVSDGFTGNIVLKTSEGMGKYIAECAMNEMDSLGYPDGEVREALDRVFKRFDTKEYGGAPMLGIARPVMKAHGNSDAHAIRSALIAAENYARSMVVEEIVKAAENFKTTVPMKIGGR